MDILVDSRPCLNDTILFNDNIVTYQRVLDSAIVVDFSAVPDDTFSDDYVLAYFAVGADDRLLNNTVFAHLTIISNHCWVWNSTG